MKPRIATATWTGVVLVLLLPSSTPLAAQGMPPEARDTIHTLFNRHDAITRKVEPTAKGYVAVTESDEPEVADALRRHVKQMGRRLESGLRVRMWDPAFAEYVAHYRDLDHTFKATSRGVRMTVKGRTPEAVRVAQNHARVISEFVETGWVGHGREHPAVLAEATQPPAAALPPGGPGRQGRRGFGRGLGCCGNGPGGAGCCLVPPEQAAVGEPPAPSNE